MFNYFTYKCRKAGRKHKQNDSGHPKNRAITREVKFRALFYVALISKQSINQNAASCFVLHQRCTDFAHTTLQTFHQTTFPFGYSGSNSYEKGENRTIQMKRFCLLCCSDVKLKPQSARIRRVLAAHVVLRRIKIKSSDSVQINN